MTEQEKAKLRGQQERERQAAYKLQLKQQREAMKAKQKPVVEKKTDQQKKSISVYQLQQDLIKLEGLE